MGGKNPIFWYNKNMSKQKGFTLLELIIVVVIILILATMVAFVVEHFVDKGKDTAIKADLISIMATASSMGDLNPDFSGFCDNEDVQKSENAIDAIFGSSNTTTCVDSSTKWCACAPLFTSGVYCVDSSGKKMETTTCCLGVTACQ